MITIDISTQTLTLSSPAKTYPISTAKNDTGQKIGSECTPLGKHCIIEKIGAGLPINSVFVARKFTGEIYDEALAKTFPDRDWILTRILRLKGLEDGKNAGIDSDGVCCDSLARFIYIHGTPDSEPMGIPRSHGCIRMKNADMVALFDRVTVGMVVDIKRA